MPRIPSLQTMSWNLRIWKERCKCGVEQKEMEREQQRGDDGDESRGNTGSAQRNR